MKQLIYGISFLLISIIGFAQSEITPEKALKSYINNGDKNFSWEIKDSGKLGNLKIYQVLLTSQKWRGITWRHQLTIVVPSTIQYDGAMLFIAGGSDKDEQPNWSKEDKMWPILGTIA